MTVEQDQFFTKIYRERRKHLLMYAESALGDHAMAEDAVQLVYDVHQFPGHIACDCASNSEIVLPIHVNGEIWGVLDIDSPHIGRFTEEDQAGLEKVVGILEQNL